jgi:molybdopterin synthase sulfur carrier subunit
MADSATRRVRVELPSSLCRLARVEREIAVEIAGPVTQRAVLDAVEARFPELTGTIRDHATKIRRPFIRFFACEEDLSHQPLDELLPESVANGSQPFLIIGAIAGG